ncbi:hypothetical protein, partial [Staphylococcus simulans]|uniref:hypothetical protein n=1 Tax=Staphylococcus simulans TaxID=1286 RepID=UPI0028A558A0
PQFREDDNLYDIYLCCNEFEKDGYVACIKVREDLYCKNFYTCFRKTHKKANYRYSFLTIVCL